MCLNKMSMMCLKTLAKLREGSLPALMRTPAQTARRTVRITRGVSTGPGSSGSMDKGKVKL